METKASKEAAPRRVPNVDLFVFVLTGDAPQLVLSSQELRASRAAYQTGYFCTLQGMGL